MRLKSDMTTSISPEDDSTAPPIDPDGSGVRSAASSVHGSERYGFPAALWRALENRPPPGLSLIRWRSPLRGPWLTSVFGLVLLVALPVVILTGLLSYIAYGPKFGQAIPFDVGLLKLPTFDWPTNPSWLYRLTQGLHVGLGLIIIPVVLAKLWSVIPRLFSWPPARSIANVVERVSLLMLVGGILFEIVTGVLNIQYDYIFGFSFYTAHYFGAWVFIAGFVAHVCIKFGKMVTSLRSRSMRSVLTTSRADTVPEPVDEDGLVARNPDPATLSRRGMLAVVAGGSALVAVLTAGQTIGGVMRRAAVLLPRGRSYGTGPNDFQINRTAVSAGIDSTLTGTDWSLRLIGAGITSLDSKQLAAMPHHTVNLPIACVEGWSTTQAWTGIRLADLAAAAGRPQPGSALVSSLERFGAFNHAVLQGNQVMDPKSLLAFQVNGVDLSLDHGYPARIIVPALPGVHCTKWVSSIEFRAS
ncbi:molybdopterin-dependent oxidoreductase [Mycobacterium simiae]|uniref:molybdopterin-dependent oxidoreductase n=1 Tax=Mycobacterium simiae TaxID=1784 RepID=UPI0026261B8D|nr:molybdopterin-dependent oxidoreductase [Mycobacterium simiae]